ncbi:MAG TPA: DUF4149 domain-containing protein [Terriglobales bacterium]|nr:DUF4149 domain-containing protein [Terriglobales bacterium]
MSWLRFVMLLALIVWIGGIIFFAFVVAPAAFGVLPTPDLAGRVVSRSLTALHWMGLIAGFIFLLCSFAYNQINHANPRLFSPAHCLIAVMLVLTAISQFGVTPAIRQSRAVLTLGDIPHAQLKQKLNDARLRFDRLHAWSVRLEGSVFVLGICLVGLTAKRLQD